MENERQRIFIVLRLRYIGAAFGEETEVIGSEPFLVLTLLQSTTIQKKREYVKSRVTVMDPRNFCRENGCMQGIYESNKPKNT